MKQFQCDICKKEVGDYDLTTLYEEVQQEDIKDLCGECHGELVTANTKIKEALERIRVGWFQKILNKMIKNKG